MPGPSSCAQTRLDTHTLPPRCHTEPVCYPTQRQRKAKCPQNGWSSSTEGGIQVISPAKEQVKVHWRRRKETQVSTHSPHLISKDSQHRPCSTAVTLPWLRQSSWWVEHTNLHRTPFVSGTTSRSLPFPATQLSPAALRHAHGATGRQTCSLQPLNNEDKDTRCQTPQGHSGTYVCMCTCVY